MTFTTVEKKLDCSVDQKRQLIEPGNDLISLRRQCELIGLSRASFYYEPQPESAENLLLMRLLDEQYTLTPFYGVLKMTAWLRQQQYQVNHKRVRRLLRLMGLEAIYPKPRLSLAAPGHQIYPYLLRNLKITRVNQVWSTDITYIRLLGGFVYLVAIIDWHSRYVLSWEVSTTLENDFCISALNRAPQLARPEIFNTDQGSQFTSNAFTGILKEHEISLSMDGRGRALDNIFVERLWRSVKQEEVYLHDYENVPQAIAGLGRYFTVSGFISRSITKPRRLSTGCPLEDEVFVNWKHGFTALGQDKNHFHWDRNVSEKRLKDAPGFVPPSSERSGCSPALPYPLTRHH